MTVFVKALKNHAMKIAKMTCKALPIRGQRIEMRVTAIKMSFGLRYCRNIKPRFDQNDS
jgi:hypothetical protein